MSTDFNKKFDPIPVLPPGIAPPLPKVSEPVVPMQTAPPLPVKTAPAKSESKAEAKKSPAKKEVVPTWLQGVFAPSKNKGVVAVAAASLLAGWYGVRTVFPPAPKVETVAEVTSEPPPALPDATVQPLLEIPVASDTTTSPPAATGFLPPINITEVKSQPSTLPVPEVDLKLLAGSPTPPAPVIVPVIPAPTPAASPIIPATHTELQLPTIPSATTPPATTPAVTPAVTTSPAATAPGTIVPASGPVTVSPGTIPILPNLTPPPATDKKLDPTPHMAIPMLPDVGASAATPPVAVTPAATPPATVPSVSLPPVASPTVGGTGLVAPDLALPAPTATAPPVATIPTASIPVVTVPSAGAPPAASPSVTSPPTAVATSAPPAIIPITPQVRPEPLVVPVAGSPVSTAPLTEKPGTDFDVDLHYPKANESYASIAKQHYGDEKYGSILAQFNQANNAGNTRAIQVPPVWWVKKQAGAPAVRPANNESPKPDNWSPAAATAGYRFYTVPVTATSGMTFREIAKQAYGTDQEWQRVFDLNQTYPADAKLPAGTRVRLTADAKVGQ